MSMSKLPCLRDLVGASGRHYRFKGLLQERQHFGRVWRAICGQDHYVLKEIPSTILSAFNEDIRPRLQDFSHVRMPCDEIPGSYVLVYKFLTENFWSLVKKQIDMQTTKQLLKACLQGLVELHTQDIVHLDIKPDNILVDCRQIEQRTVIERIQISDLENAAYLPKGRCIKGMLPGNEVWRSPEGHLKGELNKPSDTYSFGIVCIYAVLGRAIFDIDDDFKKHESQGAIPSLIHLQRQVSYFGDQKGLEGLIKHVKDDKISCQVLEMLREDRAADYIPYTPFYDWREVDNPVFKDLIKGLMSLDPTQRITASKALEHTWFHDV